MRTQYALPGSNIEGVVYVSPSRPRIVPGMMDSGGELERAVSGSVSDVAPISTHAPESDTTVVAVVNREPLMTAAAGAVERIQTDCDTMNPTCLRMVGILTQQTQPPMLIDELLDGCFPDQTDTLYQYSQTVIAAKKRGDEAARANRNKEFETAIATQIEELKTKIPKAPHRPPVELFDQVFRQLLRECFAPS